MFVFVFHMLFELNRINWNWNWL